MSTGRVIRATATILASLTAVFGVALAGPVAAQSDPIAVPEPDSAAVGWLAGRFVDGNHLETSFGGVAYPDYGLTADAVLGFAGTDVAQDAAEAATAWLADNVAAYAGDGTTESYAGSLAKLALVAAAQGTDPTDFGGVDLTGRLIAQQAESGRFPDVSAFGDFSNGITQSLAVIALVRAGSSAEAASGAAYLAGQQCDDGGFPLQFEQATCTSQPDSTGFVVQALLAAGLSADAALDHLEAVQQDDGGFVDAGVANANSTGLAAQALRVGGRDDAADAAVAFLTGLQVGCDGAEDLRGAVRFDAAGEGDTQRATAQAVLGLSGQGLLEVSAEGDDAATPTLDCTPPSSSSSSTSSSTSTTSSSTPSSSSSSSSTTTSAQAGPVPPGGGSGNLPTTGVSPLPFLGVGTLLVLAGLVLVLLVRQRRLVAGDPS